MSATEQAEARARELLADVYSPTGIEIWMNDAKRSLEGMTPLTAIAHGHSGLVFAAIERMRSGAAT